MNRPPRLSSCPDSTDKAIDHMVKGEGTIKFGRSPGKKRSRMNQMPAKPKVSTKLKNDQVQQEDRNDQDRGVQLLQVQNDGAQGNAMIEEDKKEV